MTDFPSPVSPPGGMSYAAPFVNFGLLGDLPETYEQGRQDKFREQQRQRTLMLQQPLQDTSSPASVLQQFLQKAGVGDVPQVWPLLAQQQAQEQANAPDPFAGGPTQGGQPSRAPPPSQATPATQQGGDKAGSIVDIVSAAIPQESAGPTIAKIAQITGVDPNAPLSPGQQRRVQGLLQKYSQPQAGAASPGALGAAAAPGAAPAIGTANARVGDAFASLPASAGGVMPKPSQAPTPARPQPEPQPAAPQVAQPQPQPGPQVAQAQQPQPQPQQPLVPPPVMPFNPRTGQWLKFPEEAEQAAQMLREAATKPKFKSKADFYNSWADKIDKAVQPMPVRPGETLLNPQTGKPVYQAAGTNANNVALQRFLAENPDATAEQIQAFVQGGRGGRSAIAMYMNKFLQEHPDATADEVKGAAQTYTTQTTALNRFQSGPQGNTIRSFNVLVDHLGTLDSAIGALKNGDIKAFNQVGQVWAQQAGNPAPTNFDAIKALVGDEIVKAVVGGGGALGDREEVKAAIDKANSPAQLAGAIASYKKLALGQLRGFQKQYETATGEKNFDDLLLPTTKQFFNAESGDKPSEAAGSNDNRPRPTIKNGEGKTMVLSPDGKSWVAP